MITDRDAVLAAAATYTTAPTWTGTGFEATVHAVRSTIDGVTLVSFEGSKTWENWAADFFAKQTGIATHPDVGGVHAGFYDAARSIAPAIEAALADDEPYATSGHSLGGALALLVPVLLKRRPVAIFGFAPPAPFADEVPDWILALTRAFRFGGDPVAHQPDWFPHVPLIPVGRSMNPSTDCHHIQNYVNAIQ
jgi:Lipase (class 3)